MITKMSIFHVVYYSLAFKIWLVRYTARTVLPDIRIGQTGSEMQYNVHVLFSIVN